MRTWTLGGIVAIAIATVARSASAWYLPEHAEITRIALERYAPSGVASAIASAVSDARSANLPLCIAVAIDFQAIPMQSGLVTTQFAECIPYTALPGLAADHSNDAADLVHVLTIPVSRWPLVDLPIGGMVVGAAVYEWGRFLEQADVAFLRATASDDTLAVPTKVLDTAGVNRRKLTRDLDARLQLVDPDYTSRAAGSKAHFQDTVTTVDALFAQLLVGQADNALAQFISHHARSLQLAVRARGPSSAATRTLRTNALFEHAFALHFLEDAFAAGHVGTERAISRSTDRLRRHDYLNRVGLPVRRIVSSGGCDHPTGRHELPPCWTAFGDGYLDDVNVRYAAQAVAAAQLEFAMALDPSALGWLPRKERTQASEGEAVGGGATAAAVLDQPKKDGPLDPKDDLARAARLLDPAPSWTLNGDAAAEDVTKGYAEEVLESALQALEKLALMRELRAASCGSDSSAQPSAMTAEVLGHPLDVCSPVPSGATVGRSPLMNARTIELCGFELGKTDYGKATAIRLKTPDAALWRPLLTVWPGPQADIRSLQGDDSFGFGFATQIQFGAEAIAQLAYGGDDGPPAGMGAGFSLGLAYRADSVVPGRDNRSVIEANAGLAATVLTGVGQERYATAFFAEVRVPLISLLSWGVVGYLTKSSDVVWFLSKPWGIGIFGVRGYWLFPSLWPSNDAREAQLFGWDVEVFDLSLARGSAPRTEAIGANMDPELRGRIGSMDLGALGGTQGHHYGLSLAVEVAGGYSWFL